MRIAIASDWFAPRRGGIEAQLLQLAERLGARGHDVDVLTSSPGARSGAGFRVRPLDVLTLPKLHFAVSPSLLPALHRELRRGYDVVHAHVSVISPVGYAASAVARSLGLPTVLTFHSVLRAKTYFLRGLSAIAGLADSATIWSAVSDLVARQVGRALGEADVATLPNGIDLAFWRAARSKAVASDTPVTLVATMRLHRKKRPRQLLQAFARAASRIGVRARLVIVGDGPEREALDRDIRELDLHTGAARAELLGWIGQDDLRALYAHASGFVLASTRESFGIAALEARAAGLPVIAMRESGSGEFLDQGVNALICDDDGALTTSIARFISEPQLRLRLADATTDLARYDWSAVLAEHERTYGRAMKRALLAAGAAGASA
jgi:glycosyltransferase involved in cell wall biosynthesis